MAFCKYCGKKLEDGEICTCAQAQAEVSATAAQPQASAQVKTEGNAQPQAGAQTEGDATSAQTEGNATSAQTEVSATAAQPQASAQTKTAEQTSEFVNSAKNLLLSSWDKYKELFMHSGTKSAEFVKEGTLGNTLVFIIVEALATAFLQLVIACKINTLLSFAGVRISVAGCFFCGFFLSLIMSGLYAGITLAVFKIIKGNITFVQALNAIAIKHIAAIPFALLGIIIAIFNPVAGIYVCSLGSIMAICYFFSAIRAFDVVDADKTAFVVAAICVVVSIITSIIVYAFASSALSSLMSELSSGLGYLGL